MCLVSLAACGDERAAEPPAAPPASADPTSRAARAEAEAPAPSRVLDDRGGWDPADDLLDLAARLGDPATKPAALAELAALPGARRIDVLRAGLRLRDDAAARACAARLEWKWIDGWECARCVDLLVGDVLRPGTEADFHELRSYLGSVDLARVFASAPPFPWAIEPSQVVGQMHRLIRREHAEMFLTGAGLGIPEIDDLMFGEYGATAFARSDAHRDAFQRRAMRDDPASTPTGPGLPPIVRRWWREAAAWEPLDDTKPWEPGGWDVRWMFDSDVSGDDSALLCDALARLHHRAVSRETAVLLLGKTRDARSESLLRKLIDDGDSCAWDARLALARRGDAAMLDWAETEAIEDEDALATLMEAAPDRARRFLESVLLGDDDARAHRLLERLERFAVPGAMELPAGHPDWRRTSFAGFEAAALAKPLPALRLVRMAVVVPGMRTRRVAAAAAASLTDHDLDPARLRESDGPLERLPLEDVAAFLETGAPDAFRAKLRDVASGDGPGRETALGWLLSIGDPESAPLLVANADRLERGEVLVELARTQSPVVRADLERRVKAAQTAGDADDLRRAVIALAVFHGLPEEATYAFETDFPAGAVEDVLAAKPVDALVRILRALLAQAVSDDEGAESVENAWRIGAVRDPRVLDWLREVRRRRELGAYWYATSQLAAAGDAAARAEYWKVILDGRYRIIDDAGDEFGRTLGWDLAATLPHWISELETNCCRANVAEHVLRDTIGFREGSSARTDVSRAREIWDAAGGRFVRSRIAGHWVPEPR
jgi:hypothetical protein